jgi:hypothetical protein
MARRRENLRESPIEKLRYALLDKNAIVVLAAMFLVIAGLCGALVRWIEREQALPPVYEKAEIVRFGGAENDLGDTPLVVVRMGDGRLQTLHVGGRGAMFYCRVGGRIRLVRRGSMLLVRSRPCARPS